MNNINVFDNLLCCVFPGDELMRCVDLYNQSQSKWFEEMVTTSLVREILVILYTLLAVFMADEIWSQF